MSFNQNKNMTAKKIILATIVIWLVNAVFMMLTCGWLFQWIYELSPVIWIPAEEMMNIYNMAMLYGLNLIVSFIFVYVFTVIHNGVPGKGIRKGMTYGFLVWLVGSLSGMATMPFYMTISTAVIVYWLINALVKYLIDGMILGAIIKK
jgi:hypothetical protein